MTVALKSRPRVPLATPPDAIAREYTAFVLKIVEVVRLATKPILAALPGVLSVYRLDSIPPRHLGTHTFTGERFDAKVGAGKITELANKAREIMTRAMSPGRTAFGEISKIADNVQKHGKTQLKKQLVAGLKVNPFTANSMIKDDALEAKLLAFAHENAALISGLSGDVISQIEKISLQAVTTGTPMKVVRKLIEQRFSVAQSRAKLIAHDQINKLTSQLAITRQKAIGIKRFIWLTSGDDRVRKTHRARNGKRYSLEKGDHGVFPGSEPGCRCSPEPDLTGVARA